MSGVSAEAVRELVLRVVGGQLETLGLRRDQVPDDFDLIASGATDSLGLLELIAAIEDNFGIELDLETLDAELITVVGPLCRHVEKSCVAAAAQG